MRCELYRGRAFEAEEHVKCAVSEASLLYTAGTFSSSQTQLLAILSESLLERVKAVAIKAFLLMQGRTHILITLWT